MTMDAISEEQKQKLLAWVNEWSSDMSAKAEISFRRLLGFGLTIEEKADAVLQRFQGEVKDAPGLAKEIAEVLCDQIEECAILLDNKARDWEHSMKTISHFTGTYQEVELFQEIAEELRKMKILHRRGGK